ncbi:unnamed protein product, partial [Porites lobata]
GYGYITPQTQTGKILCIFVSLPGIPITMLALKSIGEVIAYYVNAFVTKFEKKILKRADPKQVQTKSASILFLLMVVLIVINGLFMKPLTEWGLLEGIYFWFITLTTTGFGYGYITPQTSDGQLLCILVCLMGIPLSLLTLKSVGQLVAHRIRTVVATFERKVLNRQDVKHVKTKSAVILFLIMVSSIIVYGRLLMRSQNWTFVQGVYFCFVSFSTIGFGDFFVSANQPIPLKQLVVKSPNASKIYLVNSSKGEALKGARCLLFGLLAMLALCIVSGVLNSVMAAIEE